MRQAFLEVPKDLVESGQIDGCRWYHLLWHVYLPPSRATLVAFGLVSVSFHWNSLLWPLVVTSDQARPLTMGLLRFTQLTDIGAQWRSDYGSDANHHCAAVSDLLDFPAPVYSKFYAFGIESEQALCFVHIVCEQKRSLR